MSYTFSSCCILESSKKEFDFGHFWHEIRNLRATLTKLHIESNTINIQNLDADMFLCEKLTELELEGSIVGSNHLNSLFKLINRGSVSTVLGAQMSCLKINHLIMDNDQSFTIFLIRSQGCSKKIKYTA